MCVYKTIFNQIKLKYIEHKENSRNELFEIYPLYSYVQEHPTDLNMRNSKNVDRLINAQTMQKMKCHYLNAISNN